MITQRTIERILDATRIEEVIGEFVNLRKRGANLIGLCPFHQEKTPSFTVSPNKDLFKCFGCGRGGDAVTFLREHEGHSYPEALRYLAAKYGVEVEETTQKPKDDPEEILKDQLFVVNQYARDFYTDQLWSDELGRQVGLAYFRERGFREHIIKKFDLGFAPPSGQALIQKASQEGYRPEILQQAGLITERHRDFFRDRVIFTIHSLSGKPVAFAGRMLQSKAKGPKYINTRETPVYHKSRILYGLHVARAAIRREDECLLVEGYTDVLALAQAGIEHVVASSGTALTPEQIQLVKRFTRNFTILYDGDAAGIQAALRGLDLVLEADMNVRVVVLPSGQDPDSYVQEVGREGMVTYLESHRQDFILFKTQQLLTDSQDDPVARTAVIHEVVASIARIPDPIKRGEYAKICAQRLAVEESLLVAETNKVIGQRIQKAQRDRDRAAAREDRHSEVTSSSEAPSEKKAEAESESLPTPVQDLIRILVTGGDVQIRMEEEEMTVAAYIFRELNEELIAEIDSDTARNLLHQSRVHFVETGTLPSNFFLHHAENDVRDMAMPFLQSPYQYSENWEKRWQILLHNQRMPEANFARDAQLALLRFQLFKLDEMCQFNAARIKSAYEENDTDRAQYYLEFQQELLRRRNEVAGQELNAVVLK